MLRKTKFGTAKDGRDVEQFTLRSPAGIEVKCINYGCRITGINMPDKNGNAEDILLGFDSLAGYEADTSYHGAFVGRYANRIEGACFELGGQMYSLPQNDKGNFLHGCFSNRVFDARELADNSVSFSYTSPDGEDGFPGELQVEVTYTFTEQSELVMDYRAQSTKDTYINLTNHSYFNLNPASPSGTIEEHSLWLGSSNFLEAGDALCPTGRVIELAGGAFDFTKAKRIGRDIEAKDPQLLAGGGYDHCFILDKVSPDELVLAARVEEMQSGRAMCVYTTQPAVQFYSGNFLGGAPGKGGRPLAPRTGFCLETQHYPASPSHPEFPSTLLKAGEKFNQITVLKFEII